MVLLTVAVVIGGWATACAETRVALVIGNSAYRTVARLANPANDARAMAGALVQAGFNLVGGGAQLDADRAALERLIRDFGRQLGPDTVALFYYAGHGVQVNGSNYLVPVDANVSSSADIKYELVDAGFILDEMTAANSRLNLVILDACRNNPFAGRGLRSVGSGLAQVTAPSGTIIAYATQPGMVAFDGSGENSPYSGALARNIVRPGVNILDTLNAVGLEVQTETRDRQQPWLALSPIRGTFYFVPASSAATESIPAALPHVSDPIAGAALTQPAGPITPTAPAQTAKSPAGNVVASGAARPMTPGPYREFIRDLTLPVVPFR